ncbi:MAG TPA: NAD(P)/FAD-dependent oxidoreductase [Anaerolineales bacterium]|nr:NAD(P)/FAD-dependent oxidoreductase [Anaerolineales bacterium]
MLDMIVIGGGPAGVTAALRARELGAEVALIERDRLGGTCTNDGCVPTRVLAKAARLARDAQQFPDYGLGTYFPQVDFERLMSRTQQRVYRIHEKKQIINHLQDNGIQVYSDAGPARFIDSHTVELAGNRTLQASQFIISAGGHARRINFPGSELALTHSDIWGLKKLPRSLAIVGGAATGCQLASIFSAFGTEVTILEMHPYIIGLEDDLVSATITEAFLRRGIQVITQIGGVDRIERVGDELQLWYQLNGQAQSLQAEAIVLAVGWVGNIESMNLEAAGVRTERGYIVVNDNLQTSASHIFAAGDITGRMMLVQSGSYDGRIASENAILGVQQPYRHQIVPHGGFTDPEYGSVGLTEKQARESGMDITIAIVPYQDLDRAVIDGRTEGMCKLIINTDTHRIVGAHIVGEQALETIHLVAAGMAADMWVEQLAELEIAYPTFTASIGLAARQIVRALGVMPLAAQWRSLGKPHAEWEHSSPA